MRGLPLAEIEFRLATLPPISRGAHLAGPQLHAERLTELWKADGEVALAEAFRLLDVGTVAGIILRAVTSGDYDEGDPRHWHFPPFADLLPPLREAAWQEILAGKLVLDAIRGVTGRQHRPLAPALLPRLTPDWGLSRLIRDGRDEYIEVRVRSMPATDIPRPWQGKPSREDVEAAASGIAKEYPPPAQLPFKEFWAALKARVSPKVTRQQALDALEARAKHLWGRPGYSSKGKSPN
jgi:hypothetical protein